MPSQTLIVECERALKVVIDAMGLGDTYPCFTSFGNTFDIEQNQILVEAEGSTEEVIANTGIHSVRLKVAVFETAVKGDTESTASATVFAGLCNANLPNAMMEASGNRLFIYDRPDSKPSYNNAEVGDSWQQVLTFSIDCTLTE